MPMKSIREFIEESKKVWKVMRKPTKKEIELMLKVTLLAIFLIGAIGYAISRLIDIVLGIM